MSVVGTIVTFDLKYGFEDKEGNVHKEVEMRKVRNSDIIEIQKDIGLKAIAKENLTLNTRNPVIAMRVNSHVAEMFSLLFTRVVLRIGTIETPKKHVFLDMFQEDMAILMQQYAKQNELDIEETKDMLGEDHPLV